MFFLNVSPKPAHLLSPIRFPRRIHNESAAPAQPLLTAEGVKPRLEPKTTSIKNYTYPISDVRTMDLHVVRVRIANVSRFKVQ